MARASPAQGLFERGAARASADIQSRPAIEGFPALQASSSSLTLEKNL
jgi:hypothetical protein